MCVCVFLSDHGVKYSCLTIDCSLSLDMDGRKATLKINGHEMSMAFSETLTSISYIGFGVKHTETLFSELRIKK